MNISRLFGNFKFGCKKYSPEILIIVGVIGTVTSAIMACKATMKVNDILEETNETLDKIHDAADDIADGITVKTKDGNEYTMDTVKKDTTIVYVQTGFKFVKLYAPAVIFGVLSLASILTSNKILRKRNAALTVAYAVLDKGFKEYRSRIIERFGEKVDHQILHNITEVEVDEVTVNADGTESINKKTIEVMDGSSHSPYAKIFDEYNDNWAKSPEYNLFYLKSVQSFMNDKLIAQGHLFLNDVYKELGFKPTQAGQVVGWVYDPTNPEIDSKVDFGIFDIYTCSAGASERKTAFINGYETSIVLDFNVDGNIWDSIGTRKYNH